MTSPLFYIFAALMVVGGGMVVFMRNPVSSALSMVLSFIGLAGLFIGLNAYFIGILQILVYAGAIMVLFIFIIMLLDLKKEERQSRNGAALAAGIIIPVVLLIQIAGVLSAQKNEDLPELKLAEVAKEHKEGTMIQKRLAEGRLPDTHLIGHKLFNSEDGYHFPLQVIAVLLLVATVGCVCLSKKNAQVLAKNAPTPEPKPDPTPAPATEVKTEVKEEGKKVTVVDEKPETKSEPAANTTKDEKRGLIYTAAPDDVDDLKVISGVGPKLEEKLNKFGIYTYKQVADWSEENIAEFDDLLTFKGRITRDGWLSQAADLHAKKSS